MLVPEYLEANDERKREMRVSVAAELQNLKLYEREK